MIQKGSKVTGKWAQKFLDRVEEMSESKVEIEEKAAVIVAESAAKRRMPKMLALVQAIKKHREDEIDQNPMLAKILSINKHTTNLRSWEEQWDNQLVCLYCETPAIHNTIQCIYCNVVIHNSCLFDYANSIDDYVLHSADGKTFCCCDCMDAQVWHRTAVSGVYQQYKDDQRKNDAALLITSMIREYVERKVKLQYLRAVVLLQAIYRCKLARDTFYRWRRGQHRVVVFELAQMLPLPFIPPPEIPPSEFKIGSPAWRRERAGWAAKAAIPVSPRLALLPDDPVSSFIDKRSVIVMTIVDAGKLVQSFRTDSLLMRSLTSQAYLLPGLSCQSTVVFTIYVRTSSEIASQLPPEYLIGAPHIHSQNHVDTSKKAGSGQGVGGFSLNQITAKQYVPLLQGQVPLLFMQRFMYKQSLPVEFSSKIMWIPREHKMDGTPLRITFNTAARTVCDHLLAAKARAQRRSANMATAAMAVAAPIAVSVPPAVYSTTTADIACTAPSEDTVVADASAPLAILTDASVVPAEAMESMFSPHTTRMLDTHTADTALTRSIRTTAVPNLVGGSTLMSFRAANLVDKKGSNSSSNSARSGRESETVTRSSSNRVVSVGSGASAADDAVDAADKEEEEDEDGLKVIEEGKKYHYRCVLNYTPLNPVVSLCCLVLGPRLAVLGRGPESVEEGLGTRGWNWWVCIIQGRLYFYMYHGDSNPRFVSCVRQAQLIVEDSAPDVIIVRHLDGRSWRLKFSQYFDLMRFKFAHAEYVALASGAGSLYMPPSTTRETSSSLKGFRNFGHRCKSDFVDEDPVAIAGAGAAVGPISPTMLSPGAVIGAFSPPVSPTRPSFTSTAAVAAARTRKDTNAPVMSTASAANEGRNSKIMKSNKRGTGSSFGFPRR